MDVFTEVDVELIHTDKLDVAVYNRRNSYLSRSSSQVHRPRPVELSEGLLSYRLQTDRTESYEDEKTSSKFILPKVEGEYVGGYCSRDQQECNYWGEPKRAPHWCVQLRFFLWVGRRVLY